MRRRTKGKVVPGSSAVLGLSFLLWSGRKEEESQGKARELLRAGPAHHASSPVVSARNRKPRYSVLVPPHITL